MRIFALFNRLTDRWSDGQTHRRTMLLTVACPQLKTRLVEKEGVGRGWKKYVGSGRKRESMDDEEEEENK